jgi:hypothetical protein
MAQSQYATSIAAHVPKSVIPALDRYCEKANLSRSRLLSLIICRWYMDGCPALSDLDEKLMDRALKLGENLPFAEKETLPLVAEESADYGALTRDAISAAKRSASSAESNAS